MIEIGIQSDSLRLILIGMKTIEGRLAKSRFVALKPGDVISVHEDRMVDGTSVRSDNPSALIAVTHIDRFVSFRDMLETLGYKKFRPNDSSIDEALATYRKFYTPADEKEFGVVAISFRLLR